MRSAYSRRPGRKQQLNRRKRHQGKEPLPCHHLRGQGSRRVNTTKEAEQQVSRRVNPKQEAGQQVSRRVNPTRKAGQQGSRISHSKRINCNSIPLNVIKVLSETSTL